MFQARAGESKVDYTHRVLTKIFHDDIFEIAAVSDMWDKRSPPSPIQAGDIDLQKALNGVDTTTQTSVAADLNLVDAYQVWSAAKKTGLDSHHNPEAGCVARVADVLSNRRDQGVLCCGREAPEPQGRAARVVV